jgi:hypothetical protein
MDNKRIAVELPWIYPGEKVVLPKIKIGTARSLDEAIAFCSSERKGTGEEIRFDGLRRLKGRTAFELDQALHEFNRWWFGARALWKTQRFLQAYKSKNPQTIKAVYDLENIEEHVTLDDHFGCPNSEFYVGDSLPNQHHNEDLCNHFARLFVRNLEITDLGKHPFVEEISVQGKQAYYMAGAVATEIVADMLTRKKYSGKELSDEWTKAEMARAEKIVPILEAYNSSLSLTFRFIDGLFSTDEAGELRLIQPFYSVKGNWPRGPERYKTEEKEAEKEREKWARDVKKVINR